LFERLILTLDFEGSLIRLMTARRGRVVRWTSLPLSPDLMKQGTIHDPPQVGAALAAAVKELGFKRGRVICGVSGMRAISRLLTLPSMRSPLLEGAVRHKVHQEIPLPSEEIDLSWRIVNRTASEVQVYALAVPRDVIDRQVDVLRHAGLRAWSMEVRPLALARLVGSHEAILLNLEEQSLTVIVVAGWLPAITRTLPFGAGHATPQTQVELMMQELTRTRKFYNDSHKERPLAGDTIIYATGSQLQSPEMLQLLIERNPGVLRQPSSPLTTPQDFPLAEYSVNLGLALKK
jgi:type IV pilus assembly protein PilM